MTTTTANATRWIEIKLDHVLPKVTTAKAYLIGFPENESDDFAGFQFWHPSKLAYVAYPNENTRMAEYFSQGIAMWGTTISFPETWEFTLRKVNEGREVLEEKTITAAEMAAYFGEDD